MSEFCGGFDCALHAAEGRADRYRPHWEIYVDQAGWGRNARRRRYLSCAESLPCKAAAIRRRGATGCQSERSDASSDDNARPLEQMRHERGHGALLYQSLIASYFIEAFPRTRTTLCGSLSLTARLPVRASPRSISHLKRPTCSGFLEVSAARQLRYCANPTSVIEVQSCCRQPKPSPARYSSRRGRGRFLSSFT